MMSKLLRDSSWYAVAHGVPMLVALVSIPLLLDAIGETRFGFLVIAWLLIGYFGVLDLGISRALTHAIAKRGALGDPAEYSDLVGTGLAVLVALGSAIGLLIALLSPWAVRTLFEIPAALQTEALGALLLLSATVPFVLLAAGFRGILEARQQFRAISLVQLPFGVLLMLAPLLVIEFSVALPWILVSLLSVRVLNCVVLFVFCANTDPSVARARPSRDALRELLAFGSWLTVTNIVSPVMSHMDRLFVGARLSMSAVTFYVTPFEVISRLLIVSSAVANVSFPEFSRLARLGDVDASRRHLARSLRLVLVLLVPPALAAAVFAHPILAWWISPELADRSAAIMQVLAAGVVINGLGMIAFVFVQGAGRSDVTARFHLIELVVYIPSLLALIAWVGLSGVAIAWVMRVTLDVCLLFGYIRLRLLRRAPRPLAENGVPGLEW